MAKIKLNPMINGLSGKVGNMIFRRLANGEVSVSLAPARSQAKPSESQTAHRQRFKQAAAYAKAALADPETRAYYEAAAAGSHKTPYNLALSDYLKGKNPLLSESS
jgi:hypothetical protein